jgi:hypothetical protein
MIKEGAVFWNAKSGAFCRNLRLLPGKEVKDMIPFPRHRVTARFEVTGD